MRRRMLALLCVGGMLLSLAACQKTPEEAVVADKSQGLPEGSIIPEEKDTPKDLGVPDHWQESLVRGDGFVTLEADLDLEIPEVYNTPVESYEIRLIDNKMLEKLCDYFADGDGLYEYPAMSKSELEEEREKMQKQEGEWAYFDYNSLQDRISEVEKLIRKAPEQREKKTAIDIKLTVPRKLEKEYVSKNYIGGYWYPWYYDTDEKIGFLARVDQGKEWDPMIRAVTCNRGVGSTSAFLYSQGTYTDEIQINEKRLGTAPFAASNEYMKYLDAVQTKLTQHVDNGFSEKEAVAITNETLKELSIEGLEVAACAKAIGSPGTESWAGLTDENLEWETGYSIYLLPKSGDVVGYTLPRAIQYSDLPETMYAPPFFTEQLHVVVTEEGIREFEWMYPSKKTDTIAENTKLLSFDKIKEKLADHLQYADLSVEGGKIPANTSYIYKVRNVQLRAANVNAYENPDVAWMIPAWVFELEKTGNYKYEGGRSESNLGSEVVILNAIDGGYVTTP